MSDAKKKGFWHYLENPAEAAKKLFPFIDVDAMMASNRERQIALGNDPDVASTIIGGVLNPVAIATGAGAGYGIAKGTHTAKNIVQKAYRSYSQNKYKKLMTSDKAYSRFKTGETDKLNKIIKDAKNDLSIQESILSVHNKGKFGTTGGSDFSAFMEKYAGRIDETKAYINKAVKDLKVLNSPKSKEQYIRRITSTVDETPFYFGGAGRNYGQFSPWPKQSILPSGDVGIIRITDKLSKHRGAYMNTDWLYPFKNYKGLGKKQIRNIGIPLPRPGTTGVHELQHAGQERLFPSYTKHGVMFNDPITDKAPGWITKAKNLIAETNVPIGGKPPVPRGLLKAEGPAKIRAAMTGKKFNPSTWRTGMKHSHKPGSHWRYASQADELSSRLTEFRAVPKWRQDLMLQGKMKGKPYTDLQKILITPERIKKARDTMFGFAPVGVYSGAGEK